MFGFFIPKSYRSVPLAVINTWSVIKPSWMLKIKYAKMAIEQKRFAAAICLIEISFKAYKIKKRNANVRAEETKTDNPKKTKTQKILYFTCRKSMDNKQKR